MTVGYDKIPSLFQTLIDIAMYEGIGVLAHDIARPPATALDHTMTLTGPPTWAQWPLSNLTVLSFNPATPDFLELAVAASTDLDFQVGAFTLVAWIYEDDQSVDRYILERGLLNTDGWFWYVDANGAIHVVTNQTPGTQDTFSGNGEVTTATWWFLAATRLGADVALYKNGNLLAVTAAAHVNPLTSARKFHVGIDDTEAANQWDGYIWRPMVFSRQLTQLEIWKLFEMTRDLVGI